MIKKLILNKMKFLLTAITVAGLLFSTTHHTAAADVASDEAESKRVEVTVRASTIDPRVRAYPKIDFLINDSKGRPADQQQAWFNPNVQSRGQLVIWLMGHNPALFQRVTGYGLHAIRVHYANRWFSKCCREQPVGPECRGNLRLEAATGLDVSDEVSIARPDSMAQRAFQMVKWLKTQNTPGDWGQFLNADASDLDWEKVIVAGSSHGSTTAARFAKYQKVARVVALCGPRDQHQTWQALPSATPENRYFAFSHVLDQGWERDHYCRSWEMLGLNEFGPIVNVDESKPPYDNTRRLITDADVGGNPRRAHSSVQPGGSAVKDKTTGRYLHEAVWEYLFTHQVEEVGKPVPLDPNCDHEQRQ